MPTTTDGKNTESLGSYARWRWTGSVGMMALHAIMPAAWLIAAALLIGPVFVPEFQKIPARLPAVSQWVMHLSTQVNLGWPWIVAGTLVLLLLDGRIYYDLARSSRPRWAAAVTFGEVGFTLFCVVALYLPIHIAYQIPPCGAANAP